MQTIASLEYPLSATTRSLIFDLLPSALSNVPFHNNTDAVNRIVAENFPVHLAVHEISPVKNAPAQYTELHMHDDSDEVNIILSKSKLVYRIQLDDDIYKVAANSSIWIPRGVLHSANVIEGSGYFVTLRLSSLF